MESIMSKASSLVRPSSMAGGGARSGQRNHYDTTEQRNIHVMDQRSTGDSRVPKLATDPRTLQELASSFQKQSSSSVPSLYPTQLKRPVNRRRQFKTSRDSLQLLPRQGTTTNPNCLTVSKTLPQQPSAAVALDDGTTDSPNGRDDMHTGERSDVSSVASPAHSLSSTGSGRSISSLSDFASDSSLGSLALTPPTGNNSSSINSNLYRRPPLVVTAKRLGSDVRRQHSKRRRRRPRQQPPDSLSSLELLASSPSVGQSTTTENIRECSLTFSASNNQFQQEQQYQLDDLYADDTTDCKRLWTDDDEYDADSTLRSYGQQQTNARRGISRSQSVGRYDDSSEEDIKIEPDGIPFLIDPKDLPPQEANRIYWAWCYGCTSPNDNDQNPLPAPFSANRTPPTKGCLIVKKPVRKFRNKQTTFRTPPTSPADIEATILPARTLVDRNLNTSTTSDVGDQSTVTLKTSNASNQHLKSKRVQFGSPSAAEFVKEEPSKVLTPLPTEIARKRYPMDQKRGSFREEELTAETKHNNSILAEWDDSFNQPKRFGGSTVAGRRKSRAHTSSRGRRGKRDGRRSSSMFSPNPIRLVDSEVTNADFPPIIHHSMPEENNAEVETPPSSGSPHHSDVSPSVEVASNLASLSMSPNDCEESNSFLADVNAMPAEPDPTNNTEGLDKTAEVLNNTWEGYADLRAINVSGGAMEVSPPTPVPPSQTKLSADSTLLSKEGNSDGLELTPPSTQVSMSSIHSLGGAIDVSFVSPTNTGKINQDVRSSRLHSRPQTPAVKNGEEMNSIGRNNRRLNSPRVEDEHVDAIDALRALSPVICDRVNTVLTKVDPILDWVLQCLDNVVQKPLSPTKKKRSTNASNVFDEAKTSALSRWDRIETEFLEDLATKLVLAESELSVCYTDVKQEMESPFLVVPTADSLQREIEKLESELAVEMVEAELEKASLRRSSSFRCQASEQLCLHGFCVDTFDDEKKIFSFRLHSGENGTGTIDVSLNLESTGNMLTVKNQMGLTNRGRCSRLTSILNNLAGSFVKILVGGQDPLFHALMEYRGVQDCFLKLGRWLEMLRVLSCDLDDLHDQFSSISIDLPHITMHIPSHKTTICLAIDPIRDCVESEISVSVSSSFDVVTLVHGVSDFRLRSILDETRRVLK